ncbi:DNA repair protein RecO [Zhouia sp. PK063]|uniref:DNA repair protein RecO n=1 Tax=Zhouia sp. PK063 TaxID=3373602 RepID=UPI0037B8FF9B
MLVTTNAIVLSALKFGDTSLIVKCFTQSSGVKSYLLKGVLTSKKGKIKKAYFQPLMQLEIVANHKDKGTLERLTDVKLAYPYETLHTDVVKSTIAMFLAEVLQLAIHEEEINEPLYNFIASHLQWLDHHQKMANFHLYFLVQLTKYLGFYPDENQADLPYFDLQEGEFVPQLTLNPILVDEKLYYFKKMLTIAVDELTELKMNKELRQQLLQSVLWYYELHLHGFRKPKSLHILSEIFS